MNPIQFAQQIKHRLEQVEWPFGSAGAVFGTHGSVAVFAGDPTEDQYHIARVISDVWLSNLLAWLTRRASATDVSKRLDLAVRLLIGDGGQLDKTSV